MKISFLGDFVCYKKHCREAIRRRNDFYSSFLPLKEMLDRSDFTVGNLETPIAGKEAGYTARFYNFNTPIEFAAAIKKLGVNLVSTANNHCFDRGIDGFFKTLDNLDALGVEHTGTYRTEEDSNKFYVKNICGVRCAFLAYNAPINEPPLLKVRKGYKSYLINQLVDPYGYVNAINSAARKRVPLYDLRQFIWNYLPTDWMLAPQIWLGRKFSASVDNLEDESFYAREMEIFKQKVSEARKHADVVFLMAHCGGQYNEIPGALSEKLYGIASRSGIDAIVGGHPHCIQKFKLINGIPCMFSLGNVTTSLKMPFVPEGSLQEYGLVQHFYVENGKISRISFSVIKTLEDGNGYPIVYPVYSLAEKLDYAGKEKMLFELRRLYRTVMGEDAKFPGLQEEYLLPTI